MNLAVRSVIVLALVFGLAGCGTRSHHDRSHTTRPAAHAAQPDQHDRHSTSAELPPGQAATDDDVDEDEPHASRLQVSDARSVATAFLRTYLAYLYGRLPATRVTGAAPALHRELAQGHATTTPAERATRPHISRITLTSAGPPISVVAVAVVTTACCAPSQLTATLEPHDNRWLVVAVNG
jgi:hypothetical protein